MTRPASAFSPPGSRLHNCEPFYAAFRYVLEILDGDNADPMMFVTELDGWKAGDTFVSGSGLERLRILAIDTEAPGVLAGHADAIWIVEPVSD